MFGREKRKSRLERENDALEERINFLEKERIPILERKLEGAATELLMMDGKYLRNLREYRFTQKSCERRKRANKRLRAMLDNVGWPKNDLTPKWEMMDVDCNRASRQGRSVPKKVKLP